MAEAISPSIFGVRIECAQCHDHMMADEIKQSHYWGLVAFFNRSKNSQQGGGPSLSESAIGGFSEFADLDGSSTPNYLTFLDAETVDEDRPENPGEQKESDELYFEHASSLIGRVPKFSRREKFVKEVGKIAELEGHHPDICFGWGYANIKISTHAIKGLAESDFILAAKIDKIN